MIILIDKAALGGHIYQSAQSTQSAALFVCLENYFGRMLFFKLTTLFLCFYYSQGYRIFIFNPIFGHSHVKFMSKIADVLAEAGHDVVGSRREIVAWTSNSKPQRIRALIFLPTLYQNDKRKKFNWNLFHCVGGTFPIYREKYWSFLSFSRPSTSQSWTSCNETRRVSPIRKLR